MLQKRLANYVLDIKKPLGKGANGEVFLGIDLNTQKSVAVKQISLAQKKDRNLQLIQNEILVMKKIKNPNVVQLLDVQQTANNIYLIMEFCSQGTLEDYIKKKCQGEGQQKKQVLNYLAETEAKLFLKQIVNGFKDIYSNKIVHRDLKLQNLLIHDDEVKIGDFGFSKILEFSMDEPLLRTYAGSPLYMSIQILTEQKYSSKCDVWSLGVIYYELLYGKPPWIAFSIPDLINQIMNKPIQFPQIPVVSEASQNLIRKMLNKDEQQRIGWEDLFHHEFIKENEQSKQEFGSSNSNQTFQKEVLRQQVYFKNPTIQNIKHLQKEQEQMKYFSEKIEIQKKLSTDTARPAGKHRIFDEQQRSKSPKNSSVKSLNFTNQTNVSQDQNQTQPQDMLAVQIFQKNQKELEENLIIKRVSDWLIYRRNKSVFFNYISQKWYSLNDSKKLANSINASLYYSLMFCLNLIQKYLLQKMYDLLLSQKLDKQCLIVIQFQRFNKCSQQSWVIFLGSQDYSIMLNQNKNDLSMILTFIECIRPNLTEALKADKNSSPKIIQLFEMLKLDKNAIHQSLDETMIRVIDNIKQFVASTLASIKQQDHKKNYLAANKELLILLTHMVNALKRKQLFKYNPNNLFDFFKYYEDITNEVPVQLAEKLQII